MNIIEAIQNKIKILDDGNYTPGLHAILQHIETAFRHLSRGHATDDDTAFTDAIYRTNQAFEGSIKEAYRVLAGQDPEKKRPYDIENYLEQNNIFRPRVLSQLTTYRTEWRNPSTHDYKLDFDESEAFLAIISVSAFSCLLLDQIAERLAYNKSQAEAEAQKVALEAELAETVNADLMVRVSEIITQFCASHLPSPSSSGKATEAQIIGALHGFFASAAPELTVFSEVLLDAEKRVRADLLVSRNEENVVIELKRSLTKQSYANGLTQIENYMRIGGIKNGILLFIPDSQTEMERREMKTDSADERRIAFFPSGSNLDAI